MTDLLVLQNDGARIAYTNYFDTEQAKEGLFFLSWNAGHARLLVPDSQLGYLAEMDTGTLVVMSSGPLFDFEGKPGVEVMFEDGSDDPFAIHLGESSMDRLLGDKGEGADFTLAVITRRGEYKVWPAKYRTAKRLPCLAAWGAKC